MVEKGLLILASTVEAATVVLTYNNKRKLEKDGKHNWWKKEDTGKYYPSNVLMTRKSLEGSWE